MGTRITGDKTDTNIKERSLIRQAASLASGLLILGIIIKLIFGSVTWAQGVLIPLLIPVVIVSLFSGLGSSDAMFLIPLAGSIASVILVFTAVPWYVPFVLTIISWVLLSVVLNHRQVADKREQVKIDKGRRS
jgi:hypothetical protein